MQDFTMQVSIGSLSHDLLEDSCTSSFMSSIGTSTNLDKSCAG